MAALRSFDAFPKVERTYEKSRGGNSPMGYFMLAMGLFLLYIETTTWLGAHGDFEFSVDTKIRDTFNINLGLKVATPCKYLDIFIQDTSEDRLLVSELVQRIDHTDETGKEYCIFAGQFETNRVKGGLVVTHKGAGFLPPPPMMDYSHEYLELSFGEYHPGILNPLDGKHKVATGPMDYFTYMLTILPTTVRSLGLSLDTNQYSVAEFTNDPTHTQRHPGIFIEYDFDPISVEIIDSRMSFLQWLARVANIYGGVVVLARGYLKLRREKSAYTEDLLAK